MLMCRGRAAVGALIIVTVVALIGIGSWYLIKLTTPPEHDTFLKLAVSPQQTLWLQFHGTRVKCAASADALPRAAWADFGDTPVAKTKSLPVYVISDMGQPYRQHGEGVYLSPGVEEWGVEWRLLRKDAHGETWTYIFTGDAEPAETPAQAKEVEGPRPASVRLQATAGADYEDKHPRVTVELALADGTLALNQVLRSGKNAPAHVRILDDKGKVIGERRGPLSDFEDT